MVNNKKRINVNPVAEILIKKILKFFFKYSFNVKYHIPDEIMELEAPYVVLPNHQGFWDPFLAGVYLPPPVYYITSDAVFRSRIFGFLLKFLGAIPKTKQQSDLDALKHIFEMKEQGRCIGIFAEGQRNWDGRTLPLIKSTSKLVRMLKIPVVTVVFKGGYFTQPRWRPSLSKGELTIEYRLLYRGDEVAGMKVSDIHKGLSEAIAHDEIEYQKQNRIEWKGKRDAEYIEQLLFACPDCGLNSGFESRKDRFRCSSCGREWEINKLQEIRALEGETLFDNVRDWDSWQLTKLYDKIDNNTGNEETIFESGSVIFHTGFKSSRLKRFGHGSLRLTTESLFMFDSDDRQLRMMPLSGISGINVQNREVLDLYFDGVLYTIRDPGHHFNAYSIWRAVDYIQRHKLRMNLPD